MESWDGAESLTRSYVALSASHPSPIQMGLHWSTLVVHTQSWVILMCHSHCWVHVHMGLQSIEVISRPSFGTSGTALGHTSTIRGLVRWHIDECTCIRSDLVGSFESNGARRFSVLVHGTVHRMILDLIWNAQNMFMKTKKNMEGQNFARVCFDE